MKAFQFISSFVIFFALSFYFPASLLSQGRGAKPNVLFIAIDDQNDWIGHMGGHPLAKTPHLDQLAERGTTFLNAHCQAPLCNPSRTSLMLGLRPTTTGIYGLAPWFRTLDEWKDRIALPQLKGALVVFSPTTSQLTKRSGKARRSDAVTRSQNKIRTRLFGERHAKTCCS